jgi:putative flippase GtrA
MLGVQPVLASVAGQFVSIGVAYYGHAVFSYRVKPERSYFVRFLVISAILFALNIGVMWFLTRLGLSYKVAIVALAVAIPLANFLLTRFWVFLPGLLLQMPGTRGSGPGQGSS